MAALDRLVKIVPTGVGATCLRLLHFSILCTPYSNLTSRRLPQNPCMYAVKNIDTEPLGLETGNCKYSTRSSRDLLEP